MASVASTWSPTPPRIDGSIGDGRWSGAGSIAIPGTPEGRLLLQNDARFLYVALDLPEDTELLPDPADYFWFSVDADGDGAISPGVDVNYGQAPGEHDRLVRQYYLGPAQWTGMLPDPSDSMCCRGFGSSDLAARPHAIWTARLSLGELGAAPGDAIFCGLRVNSGNPAFTHDIPERFLTDFSSLTKVLLAARPAIPAELAGDVLAGVGLIPASQIVDGYATTDPSYRPHVQDAAFGGVLNLIGNGDTLSRLWAAGARRYRIQHQYAGGPFAPIDQTWSNYRLNGRRYELRSFGPDSEHTYPLPDPGDEYSIDDLLLQWNSAEFPAGLHGFRAEFFTADGSPVPTPAHDSLRLIVNNAQPVVRVEEIRHGTRAVSPCDFVLLEAPGDGVEVVVTATEPRGHLLSWTVDAEYGDGGSERLGQASYPSAAPPRDRRWFGATPAVVPAGGVFSPPRTCAYLFRARAAMRVTNGYSYVGGAEAFKALTLVRP